MSMGFKELFVRKRVIRTNEVRSQTEVKPLEEATVQKQPAPAKTPTDDPGRYRAAKRRKRTTTPVEPLEQSRLVQFTDTKGQRHKFYAKGYKKRKQRNTANQRAMARELDIDPTHLCRILSGERKPTLDQAKRMADYLGMEMGKLYEALDSVRKKNLENPGRLHPKLAIKFTRKEIAE